MNRHAEHLQLLTIFHYVVAGLAALFSFFPLLYSLVGGFLLYAAHHPGPNNQEPPPAFLGWIFIAVGVVFFLAGITMAICILIAGQCLFYGAKLTRSRSSSPASSVSSFLSEQFSESSRLLCFRGSQ
jgi:hypothetical protein